MAATNVRFTIGDRVRRLRRPDTHGTIETIEQTSTEPMYRVRWDATPGFTMPLMGDALQRCEAGAEPRQRAEPRTAAAGPLSRRILRAVNPTELSTRELEVRLRQASVSRPGSALRFRDIRSGAWEAAFTMDPGHPVANGMDLPTWLAREAPSQREALLRLWRLIDQCPAFEQLRRARDRR